MATIGNSAAEAPYRGPDRRHTLAGPESPSLPVFIGGALLATVFIAVNLVGGLPAERDGLDVAVLRAVLEAGAAALAVVVGLLCVVRWRLSGEATALWAGTALLTFGTLTVALTGLLPIVYDPAIETTVWLRPASRFVTIALLATAVVAPPVDARLRLGRPLVIAVGGSAALAVVFQQVPSVALHVAGAADAHPGVAVGPYGPLLVTAAWGALAAGFFVRGFREHRPLLAWLGLVVAGLALAELTRVFAVMNTDLWSAGAHLLRLTALGLGMVGATFELQRAFGHQSRDLMQTVVSAAAAEARARAGRHEVEERAHEARNALAAIDGASQALERFRDQLSPAERASLSSAVSAEIARLQRLVSAESLREDRGAFSVAESLAPVVTGARTRGVEVTVDVDDTLTAYGRRADVAEVVQNLLENAKLHAPGSPVTIEARQEGDRVLVLVGDRGPGVPGAQRDAIFLRGVRGAATDAPPGSGLGLYVAARLMHEQGGDLRVADRPGGGAVFVVALPATPESPAAEPGSPALSQPGQGPGSRLESGGATVDEGDQGFEVAEGDGLPTDVGDADRGVR